MSKTNHRADEAVRRERAQRHAGEVVEGTERQIDARRLGTMMSVRLDPEVVASLRKIADSHGVSVSEVLRQAAAEYVARSESAETALWLDIKVETWGTQSVANLQSSPGFTISDLFQRPETVQDDDLVSND